MSLRDALLAKGLVTKKQAREVDRQLKAERKAEQANKQRKHVQRTEAEQAAAAELEARKAAAEAQRREVAAAREAHEHAHRVRRIVLDNKMGARGPVPFFHRWGDGRIGRLQVPEAVARDLRVGRLGLAVIEERGERTVHVINARAAAKLAEVAPAALVHWVTDPEGVHDPSEVLLQRDWEPGLRAHRVRA